MTISRVGVATGINSCTMPTPAIGDIEVIAAFRNTTGTPSLPAGWTSAITKTGTTSSMRVGFKVAVSTSTASGTWTNATSITCHVYRSSNYATGASLFLGGSASNSSVNNTVNYPALTMTHTDSTSWALGFAGVSNTTETVSTAPAGMTNASSLVGGTTSIAGHDTNGVISGWSSTNATTTGTAGNSVSVAIELIENQPGTWVNNFVQHYAGCVAAPVGIVGNSYDFYEHHVDPTLAGNGLVLYVAYPSGVTPAVTDDKGNTWPTAGGAGTVTADGGAGNMALQAFVLTSAATGTSKITVGFGGNPQGQVVVWHDQLFGVTGTISASSHATAQNVVGIVAPGSLTPGVSNCLVIAAMAPNATGVGTNPAMINPETGYYLNDANISITDSGPAFPTASQFALQTTATATNPRFYLNAGGTADNYNVIAFALTTGAQGTLPSTGPGQAPWILKKIHFGAVNASSPASWLLQVPGAGNCAVFMSYLTSGAGGWTAINDNDGVSWTFENPVAGASSAFIRTNIATGRSNRTATVSLGANQNVQIIYYDIANTATSPVVATAATATNTQQGVTTTSADQPSISPAGNQNCLTLAYLQMGNGPMQGIAAPSGAVVDEPYAYQWQGLASVSGTTWTQGTTTWGSNNSSASATEPVHDITTPGEFALGVSITGAGPTTFTLSNSGATVTNDTMRLGFDDGNFMAQGCGAGHYYNGSNTATQNWQWQITNTPVSIGNSVSAFAIILKGPPAVASQPYNPYVSQPQLASILAQRRKSSPAWKVNPDHRWRRIRRSLHKKVWFMKEAA